MEETLRNCEKIVEKTVEKLEREDCGETVMNCEKIVEKIMEKIVEKIGERRLWKRH